MDTDTPHRMTRQRRLILETLQRVKSHPTADELYSMVRRKCPHLSLGTVYRNLDVLNRCGLALKLDRVGMQARFDGDTSEHWHVRCRECGRVDDVFQRPVQVEQETVRNETGYRILGYSLEYEGICPRCQEEMSRYQVFLEGVV